MSKPRVSDDYATIARTWEPHLAPVCMHVLHRASVGYAHPNTKNGFVVPALKRISDSLDALLCGLCDVDARGGMPDYVIVKVTASQLVKDLLKASVERLPIETWRPAHSSIADMLGYGNSGYLTSFDQWMMAASHGMHGTITPWGSKAPEAHAVMGRIIAAPTFEQALAKATSLLPEGPVPS